MRQLLERLELKITNLLRMQETFFKRNNIIGFQFIGRQIDKLMKEREELKEDIYANEDTCINWYYDLDDTLTFVAMED